MKKLLIVDNNPEQWGKAMAKLHLAGYSVQIVVDAENALAQIKAHPFHLLLVDLLLPGEVTGLLLIEYCRKHFAEIKALALSRDEEKNTAERALKSGAAGFMLKAQVWEAPVQAVRAILTEPAAQPLASNGASRSWQAVGSCNTVSRPPLQALLRFARPVAVAAGQSGVLHDAQEMMVVLSGEVALAREGKPWGCCTPGCGIGFASRQHEMVERPALTYTARTETRLLKFSRAQFKHFFLCQDKDRLLGLVMNLITALSHQTHESLRRVASGPLPTGAAATRYHADPCELELETN